MAQIESLKKEARLYLPRARRTGEEGGEDGALLLGDGAEDNLEARLIDLKQQLDASREKEVGATDIKMQLAAGASALPAKCQVLGAAVHARSGVCCMALHGRACRGPRVCALHSSRSSLVPSTPVNPPLP
jgi:hypothetical protein